jgi:hypothetical protein
MQVYEIDATQPMNRAQRRTLESLKRNGVAVMNKPEQIVGNPSLINNAQTVTEAPTPPVEVVDYRSASVESVTTGIPGDGGVKVRPSRVLKAAVSAPLNLVGFISGKAVHGAVALGKGIAGAIADGYKKA